MIFIMQSLYFRAFVHVCRFRLFATLVTIFGLTPCTLLLCLSRSKHALWCFALQASHRRSRRTVKIHELHHCRAFEIQISSAEPRRCGAMHELYFWMESLDRNRVESNGFADDVNYGRREKRDVSGHLASPRQWFISRTHARSRCCSECSIGKALRREFINFRPCFATYLMRVRFWCNSFSLATAMIKKKRTERSCHLWYFNGFTGVWNCLKAS